MKSYVYLCLFVVCLTACQTSPTPVTANISPIQIILVSSDFAVGEARVSFALFEGTEVAADIEQVTVQAFALDEASTPPVWSGSATPYTDYTVPYWVIYPDLPTADLWQFTAQLTPTTGPPVESTFIIELKAASDSPPVGSMAPASQNQTIDTVADINQLSSGPNPNPALYQMTVAEAITSTKPTVVGFITPGLCQTQWCAPVLDSVEAVYQEQADTVNFIHIEVYADFQTLTVVPQMAEWGLETEPWVFVLDDNGRITAKFNGPLSPQELKTALNQIQS